MRVKMPAQNNFGNSSKADLKFFVPLAVMNTQNSKGANFLGKEIQNPPDTIFRPSRSVQNFTPIGAEMAKLNSFFEIAIASPSP